MPDHQQMMGRQRVLAVFGEFAPRSEDLDQVLTEACRLVRDALESDFAKLLEIRREERPTMPGRHPMPALSSAGRVRIPLEGRLSEAYSIAAGEPVITPYLGLEERYDVPDCMTSHGIRALVNVPIRLPGGEAYGLLQVDARAPREFGPEDTAFLRSYATILGPVIDRLRRLHRFHASEERFRLTVESTRDCAIFTTDPGDRITAWYPGAEAVFG
ncbi:GAF domain-containing protein [Methylobacterium sp. CB376]|uniref:GAF domain-containing protein n=1 Tax=unclassified Methylobacterium TaxID=2615210 RepID=UPI000152CBAC|nr:MULTISPECIES: GAF domain-containing protein [Methylobacterium]WFT77710.1 GAF domain-containing protein [Methylobacterium nodulans]